jgi:hypothetical protein
VRRIVVTLLVLAVLGAIGSYALGAYADRQAAKQIQASLKLSSPPRVNISAFPILWWIVKGRLPHVTIDADEVPVQGLEVATFHLALDDVQASLSQLSSGVRVVRVRGGNASASVTPDAVNAYLAARNEPERVSFPGDRVRVTRTVVYAGVRHTLAATGTLRVQGDDLVFDATTVTLDGATPPAFLAGPARRDASFSVAIPPLPGGVRPSGVVVAGGFATFRVTLGPTTLDLSRV